MAEPHDESVPPAPAGGPYAAQPTPYSQHPPYAQVGPVGPQYPPPQPQPVQPQPVQPQPPYPQPPYPQPVYGQPYPQQPYPQQAYPQPQYGQPYGQPQYGQPQYVYVPGLFPPPAPPPRRRRGRALWTVLIYVVTFAMLMTGAWFVTPLIWPGPAVAALSFSGPANVEGLTKLLAAPTRATVGGTEDLTINEVASAVDEDRSQEQVIALRSNGFRWAAAITWTGDDGKSKGTLRLSQFRTVKGATAHYKKVLTVERFRSTAEETSIVEVRGAALFTDENLEDGEIVRATFGRGVIVGHIEVTDAARHVRNDVLTQVIDVDGQLPDDQWAWNEPAVTPIDLGPLLLEPPAGARDVTSPAEFRLRDFAKGFLDSKDGQDYLQAVGFKRGLATGWTQADNVGMNVNLMLFEDNKGALDYSQDSQDGFPEHTPEAGTGESIPGVTLGRAFYYRYEGVRVGLATFYRGNIAVELFLFSSRTIDKAHLVALAQQQFERLPARVA